MHKNNFAPKTLIGNWQENRFTEDFSANADSTSNTYLQNPSYNKYVSTSKDVGNSKQYQKVSHKNFINLSTFLPQNAWKPLTKDVDFV